MAVTRLKTCAFVKDFTSGVALPGKAFPWLFLAWQMIEMIGTFSAERDPFFGSTGQQGATS